MTCGRFIKFNEAAMRFLESYQDRSPYVNWLTVEWIKTQNVLPSAQTAAMLFWALLASGQINTQAHRSTD
jgi:hypothetical protein